MPGFGVVPEELGAVSASVDGLRTRLSGELSRLAREVGEVLDGPWRGGAASSFAGGWQQWESGARDVLVALESMASLLDGTAQTYASAESVSGEIVRQSGAVR